jgi:hypothetical protein
MGYYTTASGDYSTAIGGYGKAIGDYSIVGGQGGDWIGSAAHYMFAIGDGAIALGYNTRSFAEAAITLGKDLNNFNPNSVRLNDLNAAGDGNFTGSIQATAYYGDGSGLTGVTATADINATNISPANVQIDYNLNVTGDTNLTNIAISGNTFLQTLFTTTINATGDSNFTNLAFTGFIFGDGSKLTGITTDINGTDINPTNIFIDYNLNVQGDTNSGNIATSGHYYGDGSTLTGITNTTDLNANFYGKIDINNNFLPYTAATQDTNTGQQGITTWDGNFYTIEADYLYGDGAGLTNLNVTTDINGTDINPANIFIDYNLTVQGNTKTNDLNTTSITATTYFGDGSKLTGITTDINGTDINPTNIFIDYNLKVQGYTNSVNITTSANLYGVDSKLP